MGILFSSRGIAPRYPGARTGRGRRVIVNGKRGLRCVGSSGSTVIVISGASSVRDLRMGQRAAPITQPRALARGRYSVESAGTSRAAGPSWLSRFAMISAFADIRFRSSLSFGSCSAIRLSRSGF
jgi:hypothetical protein